MKYAAVIAAAGRSAGGHGLPPMMCLGEEPAIQKMIRGFRDAGVAEIVAVTGYKSKILRDYLSSVDIRLVENRQYAQTQMFDSLLLGLEALQKPYDYVFLTPADVPLVQASTLRAMVQMHGDIICPACDGISGHPILLHHSLIPSLSRYTGGGGLRGALLDMGASVVQVPVEDPGVLLDANSASDFKRLCRAEREIRDKGRLCPDIHVCVSKSGVVLTPEIVQFLSMIEHTHTIQDACACMHMSYSKGWTLLRRIETALGYPLVERTSGGADGGTSRMTEKGHRLLDAYLQYQAQIQAFSLPLFQQLFPPELC